MGVAAWALVVSIGSALVSIASVFVNLRIAKKRQAFEEKTRRQKDLEESFNRVASAVYQISNINFTDTELRKAIPSLRGLYTKKL